MEIITVDLNNKSTLNLNNTIQVQQGDRALPIAFIFKYGSDTVDMSDGKVGFIDGMTANNNNVEFENMGNSSGQCIITLNSYAFQDAGNYQWLYVGIKDSNGNVMTSVPASLNVLENKLDTNLDTGAYRNDFENFKNGLSSEVNELNSSVSNVASQATSATNVLSSASSMVDSACSYAKSYATSATDKCVSAASQAVSQATSQITTNANNIADTDGVLASALSNNLVVNSDLLVYDRGQGTAPDQAWHAAYGWRYWNDDNNTDQGGIGTSWWGGYHAMQVCAFSSTKTSIYSKPVFALNPMQANTISAGVMAEINSNSNTGINVYVQFSTDGVSWNDENQVQVGTVTTTSYTLLKKKNMQIPKGYAWLRMCLTAAGSDPTKSYVWFAQPQINVGSKLLPYKSSSVPLQTVSTDTYCSTTLLNDASGSISFKRFNNLVVVRLIANTITSGDVVFQASTQFEPATQQNTETLEVNNGTLCVDSITINTDGTITAAQRGIDNSQVTHIDMHATFSYFLD